MRREIRSSEGNKSDMKNKLYLAGSILGIAIIAFIITIVVYGNNSNKETKISKMDTNKITDLMPNNTSSSSEQASTQIDKTVEESKKEDEKIAINTSTMEKSPDDKVEKSKIEEPKKEEKVENKKEETPKKEEIKEPTFIYPVDSVEVSKEYAKDTLVYSQTLNEWVTHMGIDIKAESTTIVKASADGKIKSIKNDPRYGLTVIIEHTSGLTSVYSNLLTSEFVVVGETVAQGQTIGTVGTTATFEIADESHLHFEILKDNVAVDPSIYLK